jgi:allantoate deiminase
MRLRRDALAGAAECVLAIEQFCRMDDTLVGTVGYLNAQPGATNVIPGLASFTIDIRTVSDEHRRRAVADIVKRIESIAERRRLKADIAFTHETPTVACAPWLRQQIAEAVRSHGERVFELPSGAGHDGMAVHGIADIAMIFVRCRGGVSHNPAEHVEPVDIAAGVRVLLHFIENFRPIE